MEHNEITELKESMNPFLLGFLMIVGILLFIGMISKEASASYELSVKSSEKTVSVNK